MHFVKLGVDILHVDLFMSNFQIYNVDDHKG